MDSTARVNGKHDASCSAFLDRMEDRLATACTCSGGVATAAGWLVVLVVVAIVTAIGTLGVYPVLWDLCRHVGVFAANVAVTAALLFNIFFNYGLAVTRSPGRVDEFYDITQRPPQQGTLNDFTYCSKCVTPRSCSGSVRAHTLCIRTRVRHLRVASHCGACRCDKPKPPNAHHCSACGFCVVDMDHHCPFLNNCVGRGNLRHFLLFLFWVTVAMFYALATLLLSLLHNKRGIQRVRSWNICTPPLSDGTHSATFAQVPGDAAEERCCAGDASDAQQTRDCDKFHQGPKPSHQCAPAHARRALCGHPADGAVRDRARDGGLAVRACVEVRARWRELCRLTQGGEAVVGRCVDSIAPDYASLPTSAQPFLYVHASALHFDSLHAACMCWGCAREQTQAAAAARTVAFQLRCSSGAVCRVDRQPALCVWVRTSSTLVPAELDTTTGPAQADEGRVTPSMCGAAWRGVGRED